MWAFATLESQPPPALLNSVAGAALAKAQAFNPQNLANTLWAYAKLDHDPGWVCRSHSHLVQRMFSTSFCRTCLRAMPAAQ